MPSPTSQSPMERQYTDLKKEAGDALLFFRVGDFYEMFHSDAECAAEILDIALTSRNKNAENPVPMCGVPIKSAERYIAKLTQAGKKVAIAEQVSDPSLPGIVERKIVSIITPGTTLSDQILEEGKSRFIAALHVEQCAFSLVQCELSTGQVIITQESSFDEVLRELLKSDIAELVLTPSVFTELAPSFSYFSGSLTRHFAPEHAEQFLQDFFGTKTLKSLGIEQSASLQKAMALLFSYLDETQKMPMRHISQVVLKTHEGVLQLDHGTMMNLELFAGSDGEIRHGLLAQVDFTKTAMGARKLRQWFLSPLADKSKIDNRLDKVEYLVKDPDLKTALEKTFSAVSDIERILGKLALSRATPHDVLRLSKSLESMKALLPMLEKIPENSPWKNWAEACSALFTK